MLILVMVFGEVLFNSRAVGRVGSALFLFRVALHKQVSVRGAIQAIRHLREFLPTIFPYRGEAWGTWSQVTFLNQRHFASAATSEERAFHQAGNHSRRICSISFLADYEARQDMV